MSQLHAHDKVEGVIIGMILGFDKGTPLVVFAGNPADSAVPARSLQNFGSDDIGAEIALLFEGGDPLCPLIVGRIVRAEPGKANLEVVRDGEVVSITASTRLELRCGNASLTMTQDGRISIRGTDLISRASGSNRIRGGSVHVN